MANKTVVIFDMDGVLIDSEQFYMQSECDIVRSFQKEASIQDFRKYCGLSQNDLWTQIKKDYQLDASVDTLISLGKERLHHLFLTHDVPIIPGVKEALERLKSQHLTLSVASSSPKTLILNHLKSLGILKYFSVIRSGEEVRKSKPSPDIFISVSEELSVPVEHCVVIEDSTNGILAAKRAGMTCIAFNYPKYDPVDQTKADYIIHDFDELTYSLIQSL